LLTELEAQIIRQTVILLDYETNCNLDDFAHPLSHAGLIKRYIEQNWPVE
jgi:hypothetical protein